MSSVRLTATEGVAILTLENPPQNLLTYEIYRELNTVVADLDREHTVRAVIICGGGSDLFCAGADLKEIQRLDLIARGDRRSRSAMAYRMIRAVHGALNRIANSPKPYICAIKGLAYSSGVELAAACDIRVASETAIFAMPELSFGLMPGSGGTKRITRLIGPGRMKRWVLTGEVLESGEAFRMGLVDQLCPKGQEVLQAHSIGRAIAQRAPLAVSHVKRAIDRSCDLPVDDAIELEARLFTELVGSDDAVEGVQAFLQRREARFRGR